MKQQTAPNRPHSEIFKDYFTLRNAKNQVFFDQFICNQCEDYKITFKDGSSTICRMTFMYRHKYIKSISVGKLIESISLVKPTIMNQLTPLESAILERLSSTFQHATTLEPVAEVKSKRAQVINERTFPFENIFVTLTIFVAPVKKHWQRFVSVNLIDKPQVTYKF